MRRAKYSEALVRACESVRAEIESERAWLRFYREARADFERLALALMRRWEIPAAIEVDDVVQEMFAFAPRFVAGWNPARDGARPLVDYVVFNVCDKAVKWIHAQRRAGDGKKRSRHELAMSALRRRAASRDPRGLDQIESRELDRSALDEWKARRAEEEADAREEGRAYYERIRETLNGHEMRLFDRAFARMLDLDEAAAAMYAEEPAECMRMRAGSEGDVRRAMAAVVERALGMSTEGVP